MMDPASRSIILRNKDYLSTRIDLNRLRPVLERYDIFTYAMLTDIYDFSSDYDFFVELTTRGPDAFDKFRQVLRDTGYSEEAKIFEINPTNNGRPDVLDRFSPVTKQTGYFEGGSISETISSNFSRKRLCYKMNSSPYLGYCLIINNVNFDYLSERVGSDVDAEALELLFTKIGYDVKRENNLKGSQMVSKLKEFQKRDWCNVDSCVLFILSHGNNEHNLDIVYGTDSEYLNLIEIYKMFDNENCASLKFKPKMFFFSACRGDEEDCGIFTKISSDAGKVVGIPTLSNTLVVHSSLPNHKSYRDHEKGTFFCQDLIDVFSCDYLTQDLETMLKTVDLKLECRVSKEMVKQVIHTDNFGFKACVYFCMKMVADICEIYDPQKALS